MIRLTLLTFVFVSQAALAADVAGDSPSSAASATSAANETLTAVAPGASTPLSAVKEADIPVHLDPVKKGGGNDSPWLRMFGGLLIVGLMSAGAWVYAKKIKKTKVAQGPAPEIKVLTQHHLGPKKSLAIIRVAGESILVGITDQNINLLKSLSLLDEDIPEQVPTTFKSVFAEGNNDEAPASKASAQAKKDDDDEFSISGIKDVVTARLKNMRNFQ